MAVPSESSRDAEAFHSFVARDDVFNGSGEQVPIVRQSRSKRGPVIERKQGTIPLFFYRAFRNQLLLPKLKDSLFSFWECFHYDQIGNMGASL